MPRSGGTFTGEIAAPDLKVTGTAGAPLAGRWVGVITAGPPTTGSYLVGDWCISTNGQMWACVAAGTPGRWIAPGLRDTVDVGDETMPRGITGSSSRDISSGMMRMSYFTAIKTETTTQVRVVAGSTAAGATPTLCRLGLYEIAEASGGDGTLIAATANDTTLFAATNTAYTRSWATPVTKSAGKRYALGWLVVTAYATPTFWGQLQPAVETSVSPRPTGYIGSLTDLPASFLGSAVVASSNRLYGVVF